MAGIEDLELQVPLRTYQQRLLEVATSDDALRDQRLHLVSPPGSGKTLLGLELARRLGQPVVVFAPTTTIVEQWRREVRHLLPAGTDLDVYVSTSPEVVKPITVLTYQSLSTTADPSEDLRAVARAAWVDELVGSNRAEDEAAASAYVDSVTATERDRELRRRSRRLRREMLAAGHADIHRFLHPNARALVDRIVLAGVGTVVLDECHHLLDHWALVLTDLIDRLEERRGGDLHVIGLTATRPSPSTTRAEELHLGLLGDVDFEVPTPAVVKEGSLAPYRDLAVFVEPTEEEREFLASLGRRFDTAVAEVASDDRFLSWLVAAAGLPALAERWDGAVEEDDRLDEWGAWLRDDPALALAVLRGHQRFGLSVPVGVPVPDDATEPFGTDDWIVLLDRWATGSLMTSDDPADRDRLRDVRDVLGAFGLTLTTRGVRQGRTPADLVLALSAAKSHATAGILGREAAARGDDLRALVVTDVDKLVTGVARLRGVLDADAGSARRLHRELVTADGSRELDPVLVTGATVRVGNTIADELAQELNLRFATAGTDAWCQAVPIDDRVQELVGHGSAWSPRTYVGAITRLFEEGLTRCLIGTRGLFAEGWNAPRCDVLVDLTSVTTSVTQQQLRGRPLRLDPSRPDKLAHRWDVVCVDLDSPRGRQDLDRFRRRHEVLWGLALDDADADDDGTSGPAAVVRGLGHVDAKLARTIRTGEVTRSDLDRATARSLAAIDATAATREAWAIGTSTFRGIVETAAEITTRPGVVLRTGRSWRSRVPAIAAGSGGVGAAVALGLAVADPALWPLAAGATVAAGGLTGWMGHVWRRRTGQLLRDLQDGRAPASDLVEVVQRLAEAIRQALVDTDVVHPACATALAMATRTAEGLRVELVTGDTEVLPADHRTFATAVGQLLGPLREPRYLLRFGRGDDAAYLAVPDELGRNKARAEALLAAVRHTEAAVALVYTRTPEGRRALTRAWSARRLPLDVSATDRWL